jgi:hypothetical protein
VDDRLNRHDLADEEWHRLLPMMPADPGELGGGVLSRRD